MQGDFKEYIMKFGGIDKLKKKDINQIMNEKPREVLHNQYFMDIYRMVFANKSGRIIIIWTWIAGLTSLAS